MTRRIAIILEGRTEKAFRPSLRTYLEGQLAGQMPKLTFISEDGRLPTKDRLKRDVKRLLQQHDAVIAPTDVYTGVRPVEFTDAADARRKMRRWVGREPRFHPRNHREGAWEVATPACRSPRRGGSSCSAP